MTITLPDSMRAELETRAKAGGFPSLDAYVASVLADVYGDHVGSDLELPDPPPGASYVADSREEIDAKIEQALDSGPPIPVTPRFWADLRKEVEARVAARKGRKA